MIHPANMQPADSHPTEALRDYAFGETPHSDRAAIEQHLAACGECALELERLRVTTSALRTLPDQEIPQRIAFVSDRVFQPSWWERFWNSGSRLGFASSCVLAAAIVVSAWHFAGAKTAEVHTVQTASVSQAQINAAVTKAVAQVRAEDAEMIRTAERKRDADYQAQMNAVSDSFMVLQKRLSLSYLASNETPGGGVGQ